MASNKIDPCSKAIPSDNSNQRNDVSRENISPKSVNCNSSNMHTFESSYVKGSVQEVDVVFTIDISVSNSLLSKQIFDEISISDQPQLYSNYSVVRNTSGKIVPCYGEAIFCMRLGPLYIERHLVVADIPDDIIIGADILLRDKSGPADLMFSQNIIRFQGEEIPIVTNSYIKFIERIHSAHDYENGLITETPIKVVGDNNMIDISSCDIITQENHSVSNEPSVVNTDQTITPETQLLNPLPELTKLIQNQELYNVDHIDEVLTSSTFRVVPETENTNSVRNIEQCKLPFDSESHCYVDTNCNTALILAQECSKLYNHDEKTASHSISVSKQKLEYVSFHKTQYIVYLILILCCVLLSTSIEDTFITCKSIHVVNEMFKVGLTVIVSLGKPSPKLQKRWKKRISAIKDDGRTRLKFINKKLNSQRTFVEEQ